MIVDLYVPALNEIFDFEIDEEIPVSDVISGMKELLEEAEHVRLEEKEYALYALQQGILLSLKSTMSQQHIQSGEQLIWI